jgi:RNA recognition motif-containing protein
VIASPFWVLNPNLSLYENDIRKVPSEFLPEKPEQTVFPSPETGNSKGFAFINFASFDASDAAIEASSMRHLLIH